MKYNIIVLLFMFSIVTVKSDVFDTIYQLFNINSVVSCVFDDGPCNTILSTYQEDEPDVVEQAICNSVRRSKQFIDGFIATQRFESFRNKFDPTGNIFADLQKIFENNCSKKCDDPSKYYDPRFDLININDIFDDRDKYEQFIGCLLKERTCTSAAQDFKDIFPDQLKTACCKCSPALKCVSQTFLNRLFREHPVDYFRVRFNYDPSGQLWFDYDLAVRQVQCPENCGDPKYFYSAIYETNVTKILDEPALYSSAIGCLLGTIPCPDQISRQFKGILKEIINQACCKCPLEYKCEQKEFFNGLATDHKADLTAIKKEYDPTGQYFPAYLAVIESAKCTPKCNNASQYYSTDIYVDFNVDATVNTPDVLSLYIECLLGQSPCDEATQIIKDLFPEALKQACCKCSPRFKCLARDFLDKIKEIYPNYYEDLRLAYDPTGKYWDGYIAVLNEVQCPENCNNSNYYYYRQYDNINVAALLADPDQYDTFVGCILNNSACDAYLNGFKKILPTVVVEACCHCSPAFRCAGQKFFKGLQTDHPQDYEAFKVKYDPSGKYFGDYLAVLDATSCPT